MRKEGVKQQYKARAGGKAFAPPTTLTNLQRNRGVGQCCWGGDDKSKNMGREEQEGRGRWRE